MRDVETLTDMYYKELNRTPTGKDPVISKFMERWGTEEQLHGELLNRFLAEAGLWIGRKVEVAGPCTVSRFYRLNSRIITSLTNLVGRQFTATHMTFGAIHEMSTTQGYRRLMKLADHPVLTELLNGIIREESAHTKFYSSVARIELRENRAFPTDRELGHRSFLAAGRARIVAKGEDPLCHLDLFSGLRT